MNDKVYFVVQAWMVTKLNLKGAERDTYAIIYGYCQDGESDFHGSLGYIADLTGYTRNSICTALKSLTEKKLIIKNEREVNNIKFVRYTINFDTVQIICTPVQATCTNNKQYSKIDNNKTNSKELVENFQFGKSKEKKDNLYSKCVALIDTFTDSIELRTDLKNYLKLLLEMRKNGYVLYVNTFKGILRKLRDLSGSVSVQQQIVRQSIERGYKSVFPLYNGRKNNTADVFAENGVQSDTYTEEELRELEELEKERERNGQRTKF